MKKTSTYRVTAMFVTLIGPLLGYAAVQDKASLASLELHDVLTQDTIIGWEVRGNAKNWAVKDSILTCTCKGSGGIRTEAQYKDFVIELEYNLPPGCNSGVYLRAPDYGYPAYTAMEVQLIDEEAPKHKNIEPWQRCGSLYHIVPAAKEVDKPAGQWNHMRITAEGDHIVVHINGETVVDADGRSHPAILERSPYGAIGFQCHGKPGASFRNIRVAGVPIDPNEKTAWFREAKFGMFIHWGVYSVIGQGEWVMRRAKIKAADYEKFATKFMPTAFDAAQWVRLAKDAGQKYIVMTSKHHDGFAMYDSKVSNYDIVDATPYRKDPIKDLAQECQNQGMRFGLYHSILDWHHPDYVPVPKWDEEARKNHKPELDRYYKYLRSQVREICTNYGPLACIWWDGGWDLTSSEDKQKLSTINTMARALQPDILINNRANVPEDFDTPEQYIPPTGLSNADGTPKLWESCITLTTGHGSFAPHAWWGYDKHETQFKTPEYCIRMLIEVVSKGGNLLLNVGPTPEGTIRPEEVAVLEAMGDWLKVNGEAIYGTTASPFKVLPFLGKATVKGNTLYLHVFNWPKDEQLVVPGLTNKVRSARLLADPGHLLDVTRSQSDVIVALPDKAPDPVASVVAVELDGVPQVEPFTIRADTDGLIELPVLQAELRGTLGQRIRYETTKGQVYVSNWNNLKDYVVWQFATEKGGPHEIVLDYGVSKESQGAKFQVAVGPTKGKRLVDIIGGSTLVEIAGEELFKKAPVSSRINGTVDTISGATTFKEVTIGQLNLPANTCVLVLKAVALKNNASLMNLRKVILKPIR